MRLLLSTLIFALSLRAASATEWKVIKINGRDFLTVDNMAEFYKFPPPELEGRTLRLKGERGEIQFTTESREAIINGIRNTLSFPVFNHDGKFVLSRIDLAKTIEPQLRPNMVQNLSPVKTVVLDPGHGGFDKGATSLYGMEKDYALDVARQLRPMLQAAGFKVVLTRETDAFIPLEMRAQIANATKDSIFVSLHFNATDRDPAATGFEIYSLTPRGAPSTYEDSLTYAAINVQNGTGSDVASIGLAASIYHSVVGHFTEFDRGMKRARFAVLRLTKIPAVLMEGGFLTERGESRLIANPEWRKKLADAICIGIENYRALAEAKKRPLLVSDYRKQAIAVASRDKRPSDKISLELATPPSSLMLDSPSAEASPAPSPAEAASPGPSTGPHEK